MFSTIVGIGASLIAPKVMSQFRDQKIKVLHAMPGRLRLQCDNWKNEFVAHAFKNNVINSPLIQSCDASSITGSLVIQFVVPHISHQELNELMEFIVQIASDADLATDAKIIKGCRKH